MEKSNYKLILLIAFCMCMPIGMFAQTSKKMDLALKEKTLKEFFQTIESKTEYTFMYNNIDLDQKVSINVKQTSLDNILKSVLTPMSLTYEVRNRQILIKNLIENVQSVTAESQSRKPVTGTVLDQNGETVIGANVIEKGTTNGTVTDMDGNFSLQVKEGAVLQISYIGYLQQEISTAGQTTLNITLQEDMTSLEELVVIGYGVQKKKLTTGASIQVGGEAIQKLNTVSPLNALQSQTPGVNITKTSGQPGSTFKVTIRGIGTTGDSSPLNIVDGVTVNNIDHLSPTDIESIDVLKDAATAAIYGARASNGIILVTTKQGKKGKPVIQYDGYLGAQNIYKKVQALNAQEYAMIMNEAAVNSGLNEYDFAALVPDWDRIQRNEWTGTNWLDEITNKNALINNHAFNVVGGSDNSTYSIGLSYSLQEGILGKPATPKYERYTARMNSDYTLIPGNGFDILKIGENLNYTYRNNKGIAVGDQYGNDIHFAMRSNPFLPLYDSNGEYHYAIPWNDQEANTVGMIHYNREGNLNKHHSLNGNIYLLFQPIKGLTYRTSFGINLNTSSYRQYQPEYRLSTINFRTEDIVVQQMNTNLGWIFDNTLTYDLKLNQDHNFNFLVGTSAERSGIGEILRGENVNSIFDDFAHAYLNNTPIIYSDRTKLSGYPLGDNRLLSVFGRVNYDYKETYLFSAILRGDGSSKFAKGHRWGRFPAVSAGWIITNEPFLQSQSSWLDFFKLRASWGQNGNQNITSFQYLSTISFNALYFPGTDKSRGTTAAYPDILANPNVTWETSEQLNLGFDSRFLKGRMGVVFDWYNKDTKDWLVRAPLMGIMGTGAPFVNGGDVRNRGYELGVSWNDQIRDFRYGVNVNLAYNKNKVTRIANSEGIIRGNINVLSQVTTDFYRAEVGYPIGYFWGFKTNGVFQNQSQIDNYVNSKGEKIMPNAVPGDLIFVNQNDDSIIDDKDKVMIGDPNPDYTFGFSFNLGYKGLDFSMTSNGVLGNQIAKSYRAFASRTTENYTKDILNRWHGEGTSNTIPRVNINTHINDQYISDRYIEDGDYWRISNITLGYDFKKVFKNLPFQQVRLYSTVQNAFTFTNYSGFDPEVGYGGATAGQGDNWAGGVDLGFYPTPRTVLFGITLTDNATLNKSIVVSHLEDCIQNSGHDLIADFRNLWPYSYSNKDYGYARDNNLNWIGEDGQNSETVFAIKYSAMGSWGDLLSYSNQINLYFGLRMQSNIPFGQGWGWGTVNPQLYEAWPDDDIRKQGSIYNVNDPSEGVSGFTPATANVSEETGYFQKKYMPVNVYDASGKITSYGTVLHNATNNFQLNNTQDLVLMRFSDVLLMAAELGATNAQAYLDRVRSRVGLPSVPVTLENIKKERRFELAFEAVRYYDLLRWKDIEQEINKISNVPAYDAGVLKPITRRFRPETGGFLPIPQNEIDLSDGVLTQNPGWTGPEANY